MYEFFRNDPQRGIFLNVNLSNLENILLKNLITDRARECIFRASGGTDFEIFSTQHHGGTFVGLMYVQVCPKKLWTSHCPLEIPKLKTKTHGNSA